MARTKKVVFEVADDYMEFEIGDLTGLELLTLASMVLIQIVKQSGMSEKEVFEALKLVYEDTKKDYKEGLN